MMTPEPTVSPVDVDATTPTDPDEGISLADAAADADPADLLAAGEPDYPAEQGPTIEDQMTTAMAHGDADPAPPPPPAPEPPEVTAAQEAEFFASSPELAHIARHALSRRLRPMTVLVTALTRLAAQVSPEVALPPVVGSVGSLSMMASMVGPSGSGKSSAWREAGRVLAAWPRLSDPVYPTSGEGLVQAFGEHAATEVSGPTDGQVSAGPKRFRRTRSNLHAFVPEVGLLAAAGDRTGSTLLPVLRSMVTGEAWGNSLAGGDGASRSLLELTYRVGLAFGVPPRGGDVLYGPKALDGTIQRLVTVRCGLYPGTWRPPEAQMPGRQDSPGPLKAPDPGFVGKFFGVLDRERMEERDFVPTTELSIPAQVEEFVVAEDDRRSAAADLDAEDGHAVLTREKVAVLLDLLHQREPMTLLGWAGSDIVMRSSVDAVAWQRLAAASTDHDDHQLVGSGYAHRDIGRDSERYRLYEQARTVVLDTVTAHHRAGDVHAADVPAGRGCSRTCFTRASPRALRAYVQALLRVMSDPESKLRDLDVVPPKLGKGRPARRYERRPRKTGDEPADIADLVPDGVLFPRPDKGG
jgi:hypothetical protein